jgi:hypothetical protein
MVPFMSALHITYTYISENLVRFFAAKFKYRSFCKIYHAILILLNKNES